MPGAHDHRADRTLLRRLASGDAQALAGLYDRHAAALLRHALALAGQRADAEDLVHAVFVKVATMGAELLAVREPASYLHRILHTTWIDVQRRGAGGLRVAEHAEREALARQEVFGSPDVSIDVARALALLPASQRQAVVLHLVEGFSFREVGRQIGVSLFTAAGRYRTAMQRLRELLREDEKERS